MSKNQAPIYYQLPETLTKALAEKTKIFTGVAFGTASKDGPPVFSPEEQDDLIDCYHFYKWSLDNLLSVDEWTEGRAVSVKRCQRESVRFRKCFPAKLETTVCLLIARGICSRLAGSDRVAFIEEVIPSKLWDKRSKANQLYNLTAEEAENRFILRLLGRERHLPVLTSELPPPMPAAVVAACDFRFSMDNFFYTFKKGQIFDEPGFARKLVSAGMPIVPLGSELPAYFCPRCTAPGKLAEVDTAEGINYLRVTDDFIVMLPIAKGQSSLFQAYKDDIISDKILISNIIALTGSDALPVKQIKRHEFIECHNCMVNKFQRVHWYFAESLPVVPHGLPQPAESIEQPYTVESVESASLPQ